MNWPWGRDLMGFTLLEVIISSGLFAVIMLIAVGAVLSLSQADLKARKIQSIQDNLRFALESVTKELRTGRAYNPSGGAAPAYSEIRFRNQNGDDVWYCVQGGAIKKLDAPLGGRNCSADGLAMSSGDITIEKLTFYVIGNVSGASDGQPRITLSARARSTDPKLATRLNIQTTVTQRLRDQ